MGTSKTAPPHDDIRIDQEEKGLQAKSIGNCTKHHEWIGVCGEITNDIEVGSPSHHI